MKARKSEAIVPKQTTKRLVLWAVLVAAILMIPFVANAPWTSTDFIFAGTVLFGAAAGYELATRNMKNPSQCLILGAGVMTLVIFIWALAVAD